MNDRSTIERHEVIVIGAGQAGLAAGYHLAERGLDAVILERDARIGDVWRRRYASLRLYSPAADDALPGMPFPRIEDRFPTGRQMGDYLEAYAARFALPVRTGVEVTALGAAGSSEPGDATDAAAGSSGGYVVTTGERRYGADQVIIATGAFQRPWTPPFAAELDPAIRQLHSADYRDPSQLADGPALVVGVSHSGSDIALELAASRPTHLSGRSHGQLPFSVESRAGRLAWPLIRTVASRVLTLRTPVGRRMAPKVRHGGGPLLRVRRQDLLRAGVDWSEARTVGVRDGRPVLDDGRMLDVTNVVWCTGFRPDYSWVHLPITGADGWPEQRGGAVIGAPGLFVLGIPFLSGFASMLVLGAGRDAERVVRQVARPAAHRLRGALAGA